MLTKPPRAISGVSCVWGSGGDLAPAVFIGGVEGLAAARSTRGSDTPLGCHSLPLVSLRYVALYNLYSTFERICRGRVSRPAYGRSRTPAPAVTHQPCIEFVGRGLAPDVFIGASRVSLRLGPLAVLTPHWGVIHYRSCRFATSPPTISIRPSNEFVGDGFPVPHMGGRGRPPLRLAPTLHRVRRGRRPRRPAPSQTAKTGERRSFPTPSTQPCCDLVGEGLCALPLVIVCGRHPRRPRIHLDTPSL